MGRRIQEIRGLWYLWQLPQTLLAMGLIALIKPERREIYRDKVYYFWKKPRFISGVSLGEWILLPEEADQRSVRDHEYGHSLQSRLLGPLYLLVVGVPSAVFNNLWDRWFHTRWTPRQRIQWYYGRFPERWADTLGGVAPR